jgi:hypothetical protein
MKPRFSSPAGFSRLPAIMALAMMAIALSSGCARRLETGYGSSRGASLNGTGAFDGLLRSRGHEVRTAWRLTSELEAWAEVIIRFAPYPGPPDREEASWYHEWLENRPERSLVYVVRDYDAEPEYWRLAVERLGEPGAETRRALAESNRDQAKNWIDRLPSKADKPADAALWFKVGTAANPPRTCETLEGAWAEDIDSRAAALLVHEPLVADQEHVLLASKGNVLAMEWEAEDSSRVLAMANGSFLLNLPLVNHARRPLAERVVEWIGDDPRRVAFVEGFSVLRGPSPPPSLFDLLRRIASFRWVAIQLGLFGLLACLARAPRLGRPRSDPASDSDRPAAHAEALGRLLEKSRSPETARGLLESYRRWRLPRP